MKIAELIQRLEDIRKTEGDIDVHWGFEGIGGVFTEAKIHVRDGQFPGEPPRLLILGED